MAQYKVPQDVEAEDKLLGPFTFRQFIYLLIVAAFIGLGVVLFNIFPLLCIIVLPFVAFFGALALPIKRDQPMETYFGAIYSYYKKTHIRPWYPGMSETTVEIAAPKQIEEDRTNGLSQEEASHRLSFLANLIDTEGYAIKDGAAQTSLQEDVYAEAQAQKDIFELPQNSNLDQAIQTSTENRHQQLVDQMRAAIETNNAAQSQNAAIEAHVKPEPVPVSPNIEGSELASPTPQTQVPNLPPNNFQVPQYYDVPQNNTIAQPIAENPQSQPMPMPQPIPQTQPMPQPQAQPVQPLPMPQPQIPVAAAQPIPQPQPQKSAGTSLADAGDIDDYQAPAETSPEPSQVAPEPAKPKSSVIVEADMPVKAVFVPEPMNPYAMPSLEEIESRKAKIDPIEDDEKLTDAQIAARNAIALAQGKSGAGVNVEDFNAIRNEYQKSDTKVEQPTENTEVEEEDASEEEPDADMIELANNKVFSVETIAKQANRVKGSQQNNGEVYISLH